MSTVSTAPGNTATTLKTGSLAQALGDPRSRGCLGFALTPTGSGFVRRSGTALEGKGVTLDPAWIYDLRIFGEDDELHWWWDQAAGVGRWVVLDDAAAQSRGWTKLPSSRRLLRGTVHDRDAGWVLTHDGHSRPLWVPIDASVGARLTIAATEYASVPDPHGNVGVVAERLGTIGVLS